MSLTTAMLIRSGSVYDSQAGHQPLPWMLMIRAIEALLSFGLLLVTPSPAFVGRAPQAEPALTPGSLSSLSDRLPKAPLATLPSLIPPIVQAAADPDPHVRSLALLALITLTNRTGPDGSPSNDALPLLEPYLPTLAQHLADPDPRIGQLTALFLGGFLAKPSSSVLLPLLSTLTLPNPPTQFHLSVVVALLTLGADSPAHPEIAPAILRFLLRPDLPPALLPLFLDAIANHPRHSTVLDAGLLTFLDSTHPPIVRAALIAILPRLALTMAELQSTRARLTHLTTLTTEEPSVRSQASSILPCWHSPRSSDPCPSPAVHYRMLPTPPKPAVTPPHYQSPPIS